MHIILATYNGERYLAALLDSIIAQSDPDWTLLVRDDLSSDGTLALLRCYCERDPRIVLIDDGLGRLGVRDNFARLLNEAEVNGARFFALCDQDDVWRSEKLGRMRSALEESECRSGAEVPRLAYADLQLIDGDDRLMAASHFAYAGASAVRKGVDVWLLAHNVIPGCAMVGNRALLSLALPLPRGVLHHDWWLAVLAATVGEVITVDSVLTEYRQHSGNVIGAASPMRKAIGFFTHFRDSVKCGQSQYFAAIVQSTALLERVKRNPYLAPSSVWLKAAHAVVDGLGSGSRLCRVKAALFGPVKRIGIARNVLTVMMSVLGLPGGRG